MAVLPKLETAEFIRPNGRPLPDLIERQAQAYYVTRGTVRLRVMLATAPTDDPRGTIIFCPGRTEFIEKYFEKLFIITASSSNSKSVTIVECVASKAYCFKSSAYFHEMKRPVEAIKTTRTNKTNRILLIQIMQLKQMYWA